MRKRHSGGTPPEPPLGWRWVKNGKNQHKLVKAK